MEHRYILLKNDFGSHIGYGIAAVADYDDRVSVLQSFLDIGTDGNAISRLADRCNQLKLSLCHFKDVVDDFLVS